MKDAVDGVKNFGKTTREEMEIAKQLEKERAELIIFERDANHKWRLKIWLRLTFNIV